MDMHYDATDDHIWKVVHTPLYISFIMAGGTPADWDK